MEKFSYRQPYIIIGALIERGGKFLLLQENHAPNAGLWNIPSGKLDFGEQPIDGVRREVHEEAGLEFTPKSILTIASMFRRDVGPDGGGEVHALRTIYAGITEGDVNFDGNEFDDDGLREIGEYRWVRPDELADLPLRYQDIPIAMSRFLDGITLPLDTVGHIIQDQEHA